MNDDNKNYQYKDIKMSLEKMLFKFFTYYGLCLEETKNNLNIM